MIKNRTFQIALISIVLLLLWWQACLWYQSQLLVDQQAEVTAQLNPYGSALTTTLNQRLVLLEGLNAFVESEIELPGSNLSDQFDVFAAGLYNSTGGIRNFVVAPEGINRYVYPMAENEGMLGHNQIISASAQPNDDTQRTIKSRRIVLSQPHQMRMGGFGVVARKAVYKNESFWGIVSMMIDIPKVMEAAGLNPHTTNLDIALRDGFGNVFYGSSQVFENKPIIFRVILPDGYWELAGIPKGGWAQSILPPLRLFQMAGLIIVGLLITLVYLAGSRENYLTLAVQQRTEDLDKELAERRRTERTLREKEERLRTVFEAAKNVSFVITDNADVEPNILEFSPGAEKIFGYKREDILGKSILLLHSPEDCAKFPEVQRKLREDKTGFSGTVTLIRRSGEMFPALLSIYPLLDEKGKMYAALGVAIDITDRRRMEDELLRAKEAAEASACAKSEFTASMSHEIRTPLNAVIGLTDLLMETDLMPEQRDYIETIRASGVSLLAIINEILDFSKIDAGKMELSSKPFDLQECVEACLDIVAAKAAEKGIEIGYLIDEGVPEGLAGDQNRLKQVLTNLLGNAVKFTEKGEIMVIVDANEQEIHFAVMDTGIGIPVEDMPKLFRPFSQVDMTHTRKYGGTGLGLAISKRLVEMMGGRIWVESLSGRGSIFHFTILAKAVPRPSKPMPQFEGRNAIIAVIKEADRRALTRLLRIFSISTKEASLVSQAIDMARKSKFDLLIADARIPELVDLAEELHDLNMRVILLAPIGQRPPEAERLFARVLTRPIKSAQLSSTLKELFAAKKPGAALEPIVEQKADNERFRILLAEDNLVNQKVAMSMLRHLGYRADVVGNGLEVLSALEHQSYDVILMDVQMPEMDGLEAARRIRENGPSSRQPKIIAITAYSFEGDREHCLKTGMNGYISKPVKMEDLRAVLDAQLHDR